MGSGLLADRYELLDTVGKGATGEVWRATDTLLGRTVAIKLVQIEGARDPAMAERFRREGVAIATLNHPAIVKVFDSGTDAHRGWLVMELLAGPNISVLVKQNGPVTTAVGLPLLAEVASGLQAAHDQGITHRDVKPANIVLDAPPDADGTLPDLLAHPELGRPVLVDFGIARLVDESGTQLTRPATAIGTAAYMSPEQARGQQVDSPSDVYSLACVAYHLLLGRPPFLAESSLAIAHAQAFDQPPPMLELDPATPPALDALLLRMLAKDPAARPTAAAVADELLAIAANPDLAPTPPAAVPGAVPVEEPTVDAASTRPTGRPLMRRAGRVLIWLLLFGMASALAYSWFRPDPPAPPSATVTMTTTTVHTETAAPTQPAEPPTTVLVPPDTEQRPATTAAPSPVTSSEPPAPTTDATAPTTPSTAPPPDSTPAAPQSSAAPNNSVVPAPPTTQPPPTEPAPTTS